MNQTYKQIEENNLRQFNKTRLECFDIEVAAELIRGKDERLRNFATRAMWAHQDVDSLSMGMKMLRIEISRLEAEIELLKNLLMEYEDKS